MHWCCDAPRQRALFGFHEQRRSSVSTTDRTGSAGMHRSERGPYLSFVAVYGVDPKRLCAGVTVYGTVDLSPRERRV